MNLSYWEQKSWLTDIDMAIVGSGLVGLNCALHLRKRFPKAKIRILERGILPQGASTKNAGFACFGSPSELGSDLDKHGEEQLVHLVQKRWEGLQLLRQTLGDTNIAYHNHGGYEIFPKNQQQQYVQTLESLHKLNALLHPIFGQTVFNVLPNTFGFQHIAPQVIHNSLEGQLDVGMMMMRLLKLVHQADIPILNATEISSIEDQGAQVLLTTPKFSFHSKKVVVATNGFASQLLQLHVLPARNQVLITEPIKGLALKGAFHIDRGYYYFRNVGNRILIGGGRNLDPAAEETPEMGTSPPIQQALERLLQTTILPKHRVGIAQRWSGIMGVGNEKLPLVQAVSHNVICGVRLGGMGVALGSKIGQQLAQML